LRRAGLASSSLQQPGLRGIFWRCPLEIDATRSGRTSSPAPKAPLAETAPPAGTGPPAPKAQCSLAPRFSVGLPQHRLRPESRRDGAHFADNYQQLSDNRFRLVPRPSKSLKGAIDLASLPISS
jgi:hypothetical protein